MNIVKIAFLLCDKNLYVPFSNYLESPIAFDILNYFNKLEIEVNPLNFLSTAPNLDMALKRKEDEHSNNFENPNYKYTVFLSGSRDLPGFFRQREKSASSDIEKNFIHSIGTDIWTPFKENMDKRMTADEKDENLKAVPEYLAGRAYISDYIMPFLVSEDNKYNYLNADKHMNKNITKWYLQSYLDEFNAVCFKDIPFIEAKDILPDDKYENYPSYREIVKELLTIKKANCDNTNIMGYIERSSVKKLVEFKYSDEWKKIVSESEKGNALIKKEAKKGEYMIETKESKIVYGILTVLPEEYAAMKALLKDCQEDNGDQEYGPGNNFVIGTIKEKHVALAMIPLAGETDAALYAANMKNRYKNMKYIFMTGIAGGNPFKTHLGDVVISTNGIIQLDYGKKADKEFLIRNLNDATSIALVEKAKYLKVRDIEKTLDFEGYIEKIKDKCKNASFSKPDIKEEEYEEYDNESKSYIKKERKASDSVNIVFGVVGSGNNVLKNAELRDYYINTREVVAFEMEGGGVNRASQFKEMTFITIRGITDFCDNCKGDEWHYYAAANAAIFTYMLIERI